jgi:hypothetical protein
LSEDSALPESPYEQLPGRLRDLDKRTPFVYREAMAMSRTVPAGGAIDIRFDVERFRICQVLGVSRYITDKYGADHAVVSYTVAPGTRPGRETYDRTITIPEVVPPGPASYRIKIKYACNFVHHLGWPIEVESPRAAFTVTPSLIEGYNMTPLPQRGQPE